ncbi:mediator of RNA polymerase II transcription subunit 33A-like [Rosa rugosa]|uniref:mediator of RNA polymerase II transcription subunit 33A-like n=1 Tax=Rosa rugosa TaxID=74645 RepID=UPI002B40F487|nr:mediator of RNA polymerase II transcription subunit 33A-like [Rosa rugosa]
MAFFEQSSLWDNVIQQTKEAQEKGSDPLLWSVQVSSILSSAGVSLPSTELANVMVSYICWENNVPIFWKFLEKAMVYNMVPSMLVLALLSSRVIPSRRFQPAAYRLYMELLKRHAFSLRSQINWPNYQMVMKSIDDILDLSQTFGLQTSDAGTIVVGFIFSTVWQLIDASLDDEGLLEHDDPEKKSRWVIKPQEMEIDGYEKGNEHYERLQNQNTVMAIELITQFLQNKLTSKILNLAKQNMPTHWEGFIKQLQLLAEDSSALKHAKVTSPEALLQLASDICTDSTKCKLRSRSVQKCHEIRDSSVGLCHGTGRSTIWLPLDLVLEDALTLTRVINATSLIDTLTGLIKILRAINCATWHDTFLYLWIAALRLVQRERNPIDSPVPHHDSRISMLLSITTLVVAGLIDEDESAKVDKTDYSFANQQEKQKGTGKSHHDLLSSLQMLGNFIGLLAPPRSAVSAANRAAAKAMFFISGTSVESAYLDCISMDDVSVDYSGNMRHLIVEACIARNLLDTSAYFWPGYVKGCINELPSNVPSQVPCWSSLMQGAPLTPVMTKALISTPASSLTELEKIFEIAVSGSDYEKISAATILCGASLTQGWNVQEHTAHFIIRLLSPPSSTNHSESGSHLIGHAFVLNALLSGISTIDSIKIFSLLGMVPQLACSLMAICEIFGSCVPSSSGSQTTENETSAHTVFSNGFTLFLKLWRFDRCFGARPADIPTVGSNLTPEYLLLIRNSHLTSSGDAPKDCNKRRLSSVASSSSAHPIYIDSFPKLKAWYNQHNACISSTLSGAARGTPVPHHVDELFNFIFKEKEQGTQSLDSNNSGSCSSFREADESIYLGKLPAWEILAALHYVVDAALTACANGRLSPRKLAMGLKVLVDFLPASLGTIVSYLTAEVTRGTWKPASMNGTDWPCPDANLSYVEEKIKTIVAATAVDVSSASSGSCQATLPLPLAALLCLTIAYKTDRDSIRYLDLPAQVLASVSAGCPWPCMPIVYSLWSQKAKRWSAFFVFSSSRTVFLQNQQAFVQLLRSCFTAILGLHSNPLSHNGGIGALLGHGIVSHAHDSVSPVSPGILYMHVYPHLSDVFFLNKEIVSLLIECVGEITRSGFNVEECKKMKRIQGQFQLASNLTRGKLVASLAASLVWSSGGLGLVQSLFEEFLPSWFVSDHSSSQGESPQVAWLKGYVVAYFASLCGAFVWGVDSSSWGSKRRRKILGSHMEFIVTVLKGQIILRCDEITWRAYVLGFISLMVICMPTWVLEVDVHVLKIISKKLNEWNETELAMELLGIGGLDFMGAAVEMLIECQP